MTRQGWIVSLFLCGVLAASGLALAQWKKASLLASEEAAQSQPEPQEVVTAATARAYSHLRHVSAIGTVLALRSVTLRNELAGTVREAALEPGAIVEAGTLLVALDVSVEQAELAALEAQARLAQSTLGRIERASENRSAAEADVDRARAAAEIANAEVERLRAVLARKQVRAPFRARVGMADVHPGQYLNEGTTLTTLQGVADSVHIDFRLAQEVAAQLKEGDSIEVLVGLDETAREAKLTAVDARVDPATRNAWVRAVLPDPEEQLLPGASVRVRIPIGGPLPAVAVPVSALRRGPDGDHVFVLSEDREGRLRASVRMVQSGTMIADEVLVLAGLREGERVAAAGSFKLREGVLVAVEPSPGTN